MKLRALAGSFASIVLACTNAFAQKTVGDILASGGKKLTKAEFSIAVVDHTFSSATANGRERQLVYKADGTYGGLVMAPNNRRNQNRTGTWTMDESGKLCNEFTAAIKSDTTKSCEYIFTMANQCYFSCASITPEPGLSAA
jgi:hypothetical protein